MFEDVRNFVKYNDLRWSGILKSIKKSPNLLQPLFEVFTNSLEAIKLRQRAGERFTPYINVSLIFRANLFGERDIIQEISVEDNGIGFNDESYSRLVVFKDDTKGFNNRGSGRIQMIHFFRQVKFDSVYHEGASLMKRRFVLSKEENFLRKNTILYKMEEPSPVQGQEVRTIVRMTSPMEEKDAKEYAHWSSSEIKEQLIKHYLLHFCNIKNSFPEINIIYLTGGEEKEREQITTNEIPSPTRTDVTIQVPICKISEDMKRIENVDGDVVSIDILPYKINSETLTSSEIRITSKGEISETARIKLTCIDPDASLDGYRYLFLLKSDYFDQLEGDERGNINIVDKTEFKRIAKAQGYIASQIVLNDIQDEVNDKAKEIYNEISVQNDKFRERIEQLKRDYLLSEEALEDLALSDSTEDVFKKAYMYDAKVLAKENAQYEESVQALNQLDPSSDNYQEELSNIVDQLVISIPTHNRVALSKYVTRRKMVIELMGKVLDRMLICQNNNKRNEDEKLLHNLIFKQHSNNPLTSDLWLINEEYMYFKGTSECVLSQVTLGGERIFRDDFEEEEERYLTSLGENRRRMRTDVLLFPSEGKCVIIEFKNPNVNISDHLNQVSKYAYFLRNFTKPEFKFLMFYGYLIGENIEKRDVRAADGDFKTSPNLDYLFRPMKNIPDDSGTNQDGSLYMEVLQFSILKERAEQRNKAFIDCVMNNQQREIDEEMGYIPPDIS
ncbi:hypothetical protein HMPREF1989_00029 [Porphyromonas gingivalis F0566]|nr:hypothetical protein HMPREF1989_00029 [Porphyromonas gingivalis F0566]